MKTKICAKCKKKKSTKSFHKRSSSRDGLYSYCKNCKRLDDKAYNQKYKDKILEKHKQYYILNKQAIVEKKKEYQKKTIEQRRVYKRKYEKTRKKTDHLYKLTQNYKNRISKALKGIGIKSKSTQQLLGCSIYEFQKHIENQFIDGMNWNNQGKWHVDHIIPLSSATTLEEREVLFHYANCQPLWAKDNLTKSDKMIC